MHIALLILGSSAIFSMTLCIYLYNKISLMSGNLKNMYEIKSECERLRQRNMELEKECSKMEISYKNLFTEKYELQNLVKSLQDIKDDLSCKNIRLEGRIALQNEQHTQSKQMFEQLKDNLKNISFELIRQNRDEVMKESKQSLTFLLDPLKTEIKSFKDKINTVHLEDTKYRASLHTEIKNIIDASSKIGNQADELASALKSKPKMQGNWGEMILENLLKESGLEKGISYVAQGSGLKLHDTENKLQQPDILLKLPNQQFLIIDAKVSLNNYQQYFNASNDSQKQKYFSDFINDVKHHIDKLHSKDYLAINSDTISINVLGSVLMFVPIEGTYYSISQHENGALHEYAWKRNIMLVSPYSLMPILRTMANLCRIEQQNQNAKNIAKAAGDMYNKFITLLEEVLKIESNFQKVSTSFLEMKRKISGHGGLINRAQKMKGLGAKTEKIIPNSFIDSAISNQNEIDVESFSDIVDTSNNAIDLERDSSAETFAPLFKPKS